MFRLIDFFYFFLSIKRENFLILKKVFFLKRHIQQYLLFSQINKKGERKKS